jgi:hypothetical protein
MMSQPLKRGCESENAIPFLPLFRWRGQGCLFLGPCMKPFRLLVGGWFCGRGESLSAQREAAKNAVSQDLPPLALKRRLKQRMPCLREDLGASCSAKPEAPELVFLQSKPNVGPNRSIGGQEAGRGGSAQAPLCTFLPTGAER